MSLLLAMLSMSLEARRPTAAKEQKSAKKLNKGREEAAQKAEKERLMEEKKHQARLATLEKKHQEAQNRLKATQDAKEKEQLMKSIASLKKQIEETNRHIEANQKKRTVLEQELKSEEQKMGQQPKIETSKSNT